MRCMTLDRASFGGIDKNICTWSWPRTPCTIWTPISAQVCAIISRIRSRIVSAEEITEQGEEPDGCDNDRRHSDGHSIF